jgi:hypothetical protein
MTQQKAGYPLDYSKGTERWSSVLGGFAPYFDGRTSLP